MRTGFLFVDGDAAAGRAPAVARHWLAAVTIVIVAQWLTWQSVQLSTVVYQAFFRSGSSEWGDAGPFFAGMYLLYLVVPGVLTAGLCLFLSHRVDGRSAKSLGLNVATAPLAMAWCVLGLLAAAPVLAATASAGVSAYELASAVAVLTPVTLLQAGAEELLFRGVILGSLCARYGAPRGVLISALLFGLWHLQIGQDWFDALVAFASTFIFGVTAAIVTLHFANLGPALALHLVWNVAANVYWGASADSGFWASWAGNFGRPWMIEDLRAGKMIQVLVLPLVLETLIVLAACRSTARSVFGLKEL